MDSNDGKIRAIIDSPIFGLKVSIQHGQVKLLAASFNKGLPLSRLGTETLQRVASLSTRKRGNICRCLLTNNHGLKVVETEVFSIQNREWKHISSQGEIEGAMAVIMCRTEPFSEKKLR